MKLRKTMRAPFGAAALSLALLTSSASAMAGPVTDEQLEYSKKLFGEGVAAMEAKDFENAFTKFKEAYRYAPHLHLFNYNIAMAAEGLGDCKQTQVYLGQFLDLVPEHPQRRAAEKKYKVLRAECPYDPEGEAMISAEDRAERDEERAKERAAQVMNEALREVARALAFYEEAKARFGESKAFRAAARRKKWDRRRMAKLLDVHGVKLDDREASPVAVPDGAAKACRLARAQEKRIIAKLEEVLEHYQTKEADRTVAKLLRRSDRDAAQFDGCSR